MLFTDWGGFRKGEMGWNWSTGQWWSYIARYVLHFGHSRVNLIHNNPLYLRALKSLWKMHAFQLHLSRNFWQSLLYLKRARTEDLECIHLKEMIKVIKWSNCSTWIEYIIQCIHEFKHCTVPCKHVQVLCANQRR